MKLKGTFLLIRTYIVTIVFLSLLASQASATLITQSQNITTKESSLNFNTLASSTNGILTISTNISSFEYLSVLTVGGTLLTGNSYWGINKLLSSSNTFINDEKSTTDANSLFILSQETTNDIITATFILNDNFLQNTAVVMPVSITIGGSYDIAQAGSSDFINVKLTYDDGIRVATVPESSSLALLAIGLMSLVSLKKKIK